MKQFQKYAHRDIVERDSVWHWLSVAQHHGLPTRLLDWTYSPYVALHFATDQIEHFDADGVVWRVNFKEANRRLPHYLTDILDEFGSGVFSIDMLVTPLPDLAKLNRIGSADQAHAIFFEPPAIDDRITNQFAYFSMLSDPTLTMDGWMANEPVKSAVNHTKIIIPKHLKWEIRDKLDQANISERTLFPGLDGLSRWLKRHYWNRTDPPN